MRATLLLLMVAANACFAGEYALNNNPATDVHSQEKVKETDIVTLANIDYSLSSEKEAQLSQQAMSGDAISALRVANRYFYDVNPIGLEERKKIALRWALIGSENGSAEAQFLAYEILADETEFLAQTRSLFWLEHSAKNGYEDARIIFKQCPTLDSKYKSGLRCFGPEKDK